MPTSGGSAPEAASVPWSAPEASASWSAAEGRPAPEAEPQTEASAAVAALVAFSQRGEAATTADVDHVMRSLAAHEGWWVPVEYARQTWGQSEFDRTIPLFDRGPLAMLNVFTDAAAVGLGADSVSGEYGGPVPGVTLLQYLDPGLSALLVNPGSPPQHQWFIAANGFDIAAGWATAIAVERALARWGNGPVPIADLLGHRYHLLIDRESQAPAKVFLPEIDGIVAVGFTATDRTAEFVASLPAAARQLAEIAPLEGPGLFDLVRTMGAAGIVINAGSDDQTALTRDDVAEILAGRR
jgi:hypothetical protein